MDDSVRTELVSFKEEVSHVDVVRVVLSQLGMNDFASNNPTPTLKEISVFNTSVTGTKYAGLDKWYIEECSKYKASSAEIKIDDIEEIV